jgi:L-histidine N-alpha-methyltransferase
MVAAAPITLALHTVGMDARRAVGEEVRDGLTSRPKRLPSRCFYDERGSRLFDAITELPEYYLTRTEADLLDRHAREIVQLIRPEALVELGAGTCTKTRLLIQAGRALGCLRQFVPFDISESVIREASQDLVLRFPGLHVYGLIGDFGAHLASIPRLGRQLVVFLGSTIGNFEPAGRRALLRRVRALIQPDDRFLLGVDLVKDVGELQAAYNDSQGVTAEFNLNLLTALNHELDADFDVDGFEHVAFFDATRSRIEMHLRSRRRQTVRLPALDMVVTFAEGELVRTEISTKFTRASVSDCLAEAGMRLERWFTDPAGRFALALAAPG